MKRGNEDKNKGLRTIEEALIAAHLHRDETEPGPDFDEEVMQALRSLSRPSSVNRADERSYEQAIWRFAAAACMVVVVFLFWFMQSETESAHYIAGLFINGSMGLDIAESIGIL